MTTTVTVTVGLGKTYATLNLFQDNYANKNLVSQDIILVAECYSGANLISSALTLSGWTTDATRYLEIKAAAGHEHTGVYNESKAYCKTTAYNHIVLTVNSNYVRMTTLQLKSEQYGCVMLNNHGFRMERCYLLNNTNYDYASIFGVGGSGDTDVYINCIMINEGSTGYANIFGSGGSHKFTAYNCTFRGNHFFHGVNGGIVTQNCYFGIRDTLNAAGLYTTGSNDATRNAEASNASLRNIPYSTATFLNVTAGSENLRPVVSMANKLLDNGANLTGSGVTTDVIGTARPQFGAFDIGAFENDIPICWNYTAQYKNSNKLFKASGGGVFPKNLRVPGNVDFSTGRMIDDGILINPDEYRII